MKIINTNNGDVLFGKAGRADTFWTRFKGLMWAKQIDDEQALFFTKTNSVHTIGMRFPIDVIYLDEQYTILKIVHNLKPYRMSGHFSAKHLIEAKAGSCHRLKLTDTLQLDFKS